MKENKIFPSRAICCYFHISIKAFCALVFQFKDRYYFSIWMHLLWKKSLQYSKYFEEMNGCLLLKILWEEMCTLWGIFITILLTYDLSK